MKESLWLGTDLHGCGLRRVDHQAVYTDRPVEQRDFDKLKDSVRNGTIEDIKFWDFIVPLDTEGKPILNWKNLLITPESGTVKVPQLPKDYLSPMHTVSGRHLLGTHKVLFPPTYAWDETELQDIRDAIRAGHQVTEINSMPTCCRTPYVKLMQDAHLWPVSSTGQEVEFSLRKDRPAIIRMSDYPSTPLFKNLAVRLALHQTQLTGQQFRFREDDFYIAWTLAAMGNSRNPGDLRIFMPVTEDQAFAQLEKSHLTLPQGCLKSHVQDYIKFDTRFGEMTEG